MGLSSATTVDELSLAVDKLWMILFLSMSTVLTSNGLDLLLGMGLTTTQARELVRDHDAERIQQVIEHYRKTQEWRSLTPGWIVECLRRDWLPHLLFDSKTPPDRESIDQRANRLLAHQEDFVKSVERCVQGLSRIEWEWLSGEVIKTEEDEWYKKLIFRNPTRSNWRLSERVYSMVKRGALKSEDYQLHLEIRLRARTPKPDGTKPT
jgi:hypothetical protein